MSADPTRAAREAFRAGTRRIRSEPTDAAVHLTRLGAAMRMEGSEPVQGALADLFHALPAAAGSIHLTALQLAAPRLGQHVADAFRRLCQGRTLAAVHPLATRWSVLCQPSAEVPARVRRTSPDESRRRATQVVQSLCEGGPLEASRMEREFLEHCISCQDKLAFMLATRELRRQQVWLAASWQQAASWLEQHDSNGSLDRGASITVEGALAPSDRETTA
ncbi:hypothetical protein ACW5F0_10165 [Luteimonas sp. A534]